MHVMIGGFVLLKCVAKQQVGPYVTGDNGVYGLESFQWRTVQSVWKEEPSSAHAVENFHRCKFLQIRWYDLE